MRLNKLTSGGQIQPDLKKLHPIGTLRVKQWKHLGMLQATTRSHPLHIPLTNNTAVAGTVVVRNFSMIRNGHGLKSTVRMHAYTSRFFGRGEFDL